MSTITQGSQGIRIVGIDAPGAPTVTNVGSAGSTTYTYAIVAFTANGAYTEAGSSGSTTTGNAALSTSNYNHLTWDSVDRAVRYDIYCSVGASPTGKVGSSLSPEFNDRTGVGDGATAPTAGVTDAFTAGKLTARGVVGMEDGMSVSGGPISFSTLTPSTETTGSLVTTGSTWVVHTAVGGCATKLLCSYIGATGDYATLRMRARSDYAAGSASGVVCGNFSASASLNNHANLYAVQGYAQPNTYTQSDASHIACGLYSCIDATAASSGRRWSTWIDDHSTTKAAGGHYLLRMSDNGATAKDGAITIYNGGRLPVLFNFEDAAGFLTDTGDAGSTKAGYLAVKTPAGTKYIQLVTT